MSTNIMEQFISIEKKQTQEYLKVILGDKYDAKIAEKFIKTYIFNRYHNSNEETFSRADILSEIEQTAARLIQEFPKKLEKIKITEKAFSNMWLLDPLVQKVESGKCADKLISFVDKNGIKLKGRREYISIIEKNVRQKEDFIKKYDSQDFSLKLTNYDNTLNPKRVNLAFNIQLPEIYSHYAIDKAFNSGIIEEDKLLVEYNMLVSHIIKEIAKGNLEKKYIVEFADSIFSKKQKKERLLSILSDEIIQNKVALKISYSYFGKNKQEVYSLMKQGYKLAIVLDTEFSYNFEQIDILDLFEYIIMDKTKKYYSDIAKNKRLKNKVLEI